MKAKKQKEYFIKSRLNWLDILEHQKKQKEKEVKKLLSQPASERCFMIYNHYVLNIKNITSLLSILYLLKQKDDDVLTINSFYYKNLKHLERNVLSFDYLIKVVNYI